MLEAAGANGMEQRRHTLLIVDDEVDVLESLRHQFHRTYRVLTRTSGEEAVEILENDDVDADPLRPADARHVGRPVPPPGPRAQARRDPHALHRLRRHPGGHQRGQRRAHLPLHPQALGLGRARRDHPPGRRAVRPAGRAAAADRRAAGGQRPAGRGQRRAGPRRPAQDGVHRGRQPRIQHADHPGAGPDRAAAALDHRAPGPGARDPPPDHGQRPATRPARRRTC